MGKQSFVWVYWRLGRPEGAGLNLQRSLIVPTPSQESSPSPSLLLQQDTFTALLSPPGLQRGPGGHLKHFPHPVLGLCRTLHVSKGTDPVGHVPPIL